MILKKRKSSLVLETFQAGLEYLNINYKAFHANGSSSV